MNPWDTFSPRKANKQDVIAAIEKHSRPHNDEVHNLPGRYARIADMGEAAEFINVVALFSIIRRCGKFDRYVNNATEIGIKLSEGLRLYASKLDGWYVRITASIEEGHPMVADVKISVADKEYEEGLVLNVHVDDSGLSLSIPDAVDNPLHVFEWE